MWAVTSHTATTAAHNFQSLSTTTFTVQSRNCHEPSPSLRKIQVTGILTKVPNNDNLQPILIKRMNTKPSNPATAMSSSSGAWRMPTAQ